MKKRCKYKIPTKPEGNFPYQPLNYDESYECLHESYLNSEHCIFHLKKNRNSFYRFPDLNSVFRQRINSLIKKTTDDFLDFRGFVFPEFEFKKTPLPLRADFSFAVFRENIDFSIGIKNPTPEHEYDKYRSLLLKKGASYAHAIFDGEADFSGCEIDGNINFTNAKFQDKIFLQALRVDNTANFNGVEFNESVQLTGEYKEISFNNSVFNKSADFWDIQTKSISFSEAKFHENVEMFSCLFGTEEEEKENDKSAHTEVNQKNELYFDYASFYGELSISEINFLDLVDFSGCAFHKQTIFYGEKTPVFLDGCKFRNIKLPSEGKLIFEQVDLAKASFHDTNISEVIFRDVYWRQSEGQIQKFLRGESYILWDEIRPLEGMMDSRFESKTAENYSQLVINHEKKRNFEAAEYFYIGEMEIKRKKHYYIKDEYDFHDEEEIASNQRLRTKLQNLKLDFTPFIKNNFNGYGIYLISSRYGTSYKQALLVLLLLVLTFSFLFMFSGFKVKDNKTIISEQTKDKDNKTTTSARIIEYNLFSDATHKPTSFWNFVSDARESVLFSLSIVTFQRERFYEPIGWQSRLLLYLAVLFITSQVAFVLLAIRRKFKR